MKIMVIGCGSIGERHAKNLEGLGHEVLRFDPVIFLHKHYYDMLLQAVAVVISAPTSMHDDYMEDCVAYAKPFFVEKPIADNILGSVIDDAKKAAMCGYNLRFHSCVKKAKEWLDAGLIGKPLWANFTLGQHSEKPPYLRTGVILNWSHELDLALYLLGSANLVASSTRINGDLRPGTASSDVNVFAMARDDMTDILLTHEGGCRSTVHLDYLTDTEIREFRIVGTEGCIEVNLTLKGMAVIKPNGAYYNSYMGIHDWNQTYIEEMQAFIDRIDGKETIGCSGEEGLRVLEICLEVRKQAGLP